MGEETNFFSIELQLTDVNIPPPRIPQLHSSYMWAAHSDFIPKCTVLWRWDNFTLWKKKTANKTSAR